MNIKDKLAILGIGAFSLIPISLIPISIGNCIGQAYYENRIENHTKILDVNGDGKLDLYIGYGNKDFPDRVYLNVDGKFKNIEDCLEVEKFK